MDLLFSIILSLQKCNMILIYPTDHIESIIVLMVECVGYIVCGGRWADLVVWDYRLTVPTRNRIDKPIRLRSIIVIVYLALCFTWTETVKIMIYSGSCGRVLDNFSEPIFQSILLFS
jgi:hypothetical protein